MEHTELQSQIDERLSEQMCLQLLHKRVYSSYVLWKSRLQSRSHSFKGSIIFSFEPSVREKPLKPGQRTSVTGQWEEHITYCMNAGACPSGALYVDLTPEFASLCVD